MEDDFKDLDEFLRKSLEVETTSLEFTDAVLERIKAIESTKEKALHSLLQKHGTEIPSEDFTYKVMQQVNKHAELRAYQPVITKKAWVFILLVLLATISYTLVKSDTPKNQSSILYSYLSSFEKIFTFEVPTILTSPIFALSLFALSSLLSIDYFLKNKSFL